MCAMSLSAGLLIDIICTSIREFEYCLKDKLNEDESLWNRMTGWITKAVEAAEEVVDEAAEDMNLKAESSEDEQEENQQEIQENDNDKNQNNGDVELGIMNSNAKQKDS
eukprot:CAMPEP_0201593150 /NCGR_PEP_ID=MMETSP0190_2-20130828/190854_1 /ASSEMBLY_ACC=CAM_ASM_000263 /TAXON_ID=37353 /ORGANISM="Rosalina sp." /LENGTH=108 /DNA_ID=CAMNT_0048052249 /DNA_START=562 /DNA_END=888 /DNA_ORIENTATION=-